MPIWFSPGLVVPAFGQSESPEHCTICTAESYLLDHSLAISARAESRGDPAELAFILVFHKLSLSRPIIHLCEQDKAKVIC